MATSAIAAGGTLLKIKWEETGSGATSGYDTIAEIVDITGPSLSSDTVDLTSHDSFSGEGGWEEHAATVLRSGDVTFDINYVPTNDTHSTYSGNTTPGSGAAPGLLYIMENKTAETFQLEFPDTTGTTWDFSALVTGYEPAMPHDGSLDASVTLKPTAQPTLN